MSVISIQTEIVNKIKAIPGINPNGVFAYEEPTWQVYPAISVTLKSSNAKFRTTLQNERHYIFSIRFYQEIAKGNIGAKQAEANLMNLIDLVLDSFDRDLKLNGTDVWTLPAVVSGGWIQNQPVRTFEIEVEAIDLVNTN